MAASETFDGQERVMSHEAWDLQILATAHSASCGHPGFVPDDYLEHLDGLSIKTTLTAAELCAIGLWERVDGGYRVLDWEAVEVCLDNVRRRRGEDPFAMAWDQDNELKIWAQRATPMAVSPPCSECGAPAISIQLVPPGHELAENHERNTGGTSAERDRKPGQWWLQVTGPEPGKVHGVSVDAGRARRITQAFRPPLRFAQVHTAGFHDDAGFCPGCDAAYCWQHWQASESGTARCPRGHSKNLNELWLS